MQQVVAVETQVANSRNISFHERVMGHHYHDISLHLHAPVNASVPRRALTAGQRKAGLANGVLLYRVGWDSGRGYDRDSLWVALLDQQVVGVWHASPISSVEHWALGSRTSRDPSVRRFAAWRRAVRVLRLSGL